MYNTAPEPARCVRAGIRLDKQTFKNAIAKARLLRPRVVNVGAHYAVDRSNGTFATVIFTVRDGGIWATCNCPAHTRGRFNHGEPLPCYHIAAAALSRKRQGERIGEAHAVTERPLHSHYCRLCGSLYDCGATGCADIDDLPCDACEQGELNRMTREACAVC
jgi:hypothetical protein